jgi:hypothetical protein
VVELDTVAYRFKLIELEQEISFIDQVRLEVELRNPATASTAILSSSREAPPLEGCGVRSALSA